MSHSIRKARPLLARAVTCLAAALACASVGASRAQALVTPNASVGAKQTCAYSANSISALSTFASTVGISSIDCGEVYDYVQTWSAWDHPWFLGGNPDGNWAGWVKGAPSGHARQLVISAPLIPTSEDSDPNWRAEGAGGQFNGYATQLATNLVSAGLQNSIIVLAAEANGTWNADNIGSSSQSTSDWVATWRNEVLAMRAVTGANFTFVWAVNNRVPDVPFTSYYPGDDVVDVIGDDVYDNANGWSWAEGGDVGLGSLLTFADAHGKPIALPEWGTGAPTATNPTGDDPQFVRGIAQTVATQNVAFQAYFDNGSWQTQLIDGPQGLAAFHSAFATAGTTPTTVASTSAPAPTGVTAPAPTYSGTAGIATSAPAPPARPTVSAATVATPARTAAGTTSAVRPAPGKVKPARRVNRRRHPRARRGSR